MKKKSKPTTKQKPLLLVVFGILLVLVVFFSVWGGISKIKQIYYGYVTRQAYHKEYKNLQSALIGLGLDEKIGAPSFCRVEEIATDGITVSKVLFCSIQTDNYIEITDANKQEVLNAAKQLDELTNKNNGSTQTNIDTTFSKYITDIANGIDYHPDFGATFVRGNYLCAVHINVAYSNPKTPAYSIQFGCNAPRVTQDDLYLLPPDNN